MDQRRQRSHSNTDFGDTTVSLPNYSPQVQKETTAIGSAACADFANFETFEATEDFVDGEVDGTTTRVGDHKVLGRAELVEVGEMGAVDGGGFGFAESGLVRGSGG